MKYKLIHIVSSMEPINIGIWNVVSNTIPELEKNDISCEIWSRNIREVPIKLSNYKIVNFISVSDALSRIMENDSHNTMIVTHGNWSFATVIGAKARAKGYLWICYPHGMLEPWSMQYKALKKKLYFTYIEKPRLRNSNALVAVGKPEFDNLKKVFPGHNLLHIPNGIEIIPDKISRDMQQLRFLYLARLHRKKRPFELAEAWAGSALANTKRFHLTLAGPDEGEAIKIENLIKNRKLSNIHLSKPVYGEEKVSMLSASHFFVLPSSSEGFPTTILESMTYGCIPIITKGCNFPEALEYNVALSMDYDPEKMIGTLEMVSKWDVRQLETMSHNAKLFADENYSVKIIAAKQRKYFDELVENRVNE